MFGLGRKPDTVYGVLIDIGSGSVGVAVVVSDHTKRLPRIIYVHRNYMRITSRGSNANERMRQMREALFSASLILSKDGLTALREHNPDGKITDILLTCSSPWAHTISRNVHYESGEEIKITSALIHDLVESAEAEIEHTIEPEGHMPANGFEVVERATVDVRINDYPIRDPLGLRGKEISLSHITGLIPKDVLEAVYGVQDKLFPNTKVRAHTFMLVMYCILRDLFPKNDTLCIIDVTGEATEFGIVENGLLVENVCTLYGSSTLVREIMAKTGKTAGDALATLKGSIDGSLTKEAQVEVDKFFDEYDAALQTRLSELASRRKIPKTIIITAHRGLENIFKGKILSAVNAITKGDHSTLTIQPEVLDEIVQGAEPDTYLSLAARFFHKMHGCGEIDTK